MNTTNFIAFSFLVLIFSKTINATSIEQVLAKSLEPYIMAGEPGCAIGYGNEKEAYFYQKGVLVYGGNETISAKTPFLTASISKQITAHLALKLAKSKKLSLKDSIKRHYSTFDGDSKITLEQVMNHTSGIAEHWNIFELQGRTLFEKYHQQDGLALLEQDLLLEFIPGSQFKYSNGGYLALSQVIENISSNTLNQLLNKSVNTNINTRLWYLDDTKELPRDIAVGHVKGESGFKTFIGKSRLYGPGNIVVNSTDFSQWARYLNQSLVTFPAYIEAQNNSVKYNNYFAGLYMEEDLNGQKFVQHGGYYENYTQSIVLIPEWQSYAFALCNRADFRPSKIVYQVLEQLTPLKTIASPLKLKIKNDVFPETGLYINEQKNDIAMLFNQEGRFYYYGRFVNSPKPLVSIANNRWKVQLSSGTIEFEKTNKSIFRISNRQNVETYQRINQIQESEIDRKPYQLFNNATIGTVGFSFAKTGKINFINSVGEIPLQCNSKHYCWSEEGYVTVNMVSSDKIIVSTNDLKNIPFIKGAGVSE